MKVIFDLLPKFWVYPALGGSINSYNSRFQKATQKFSETGSPSKELLKKQIIYSGLLGTAKGLLRNLIGEVADQYHHRQKVPFQALQDLPRRRASMTALP